LIENQIVSLLVIGQTTVTPAIPTEISKWIFFACIMVSFLLLIWDAFKARRILATRDISLAFTNVMTNRYLSMKDYRYFCLFRAINANSRKGIENYAFFIFFQLKGWKRLLLAEAPRQVINVVTLEALVPEWLKIRDGYVSFDNSVLGENWMQRILTGTMAFSVLMFAISFILVCIAAVLYIPLLCHIRGNLKEYCCHKIDKRISALLRKQVLSKYGGHIRPNHIVPEADSFVDESNYYKRPLAANKMTNGGLLMSPIEEFENPSCFQKSLESSPMMSSSVLQQQHSTSENGQYLIGSDHYDQGGSQRVKGTGVTIEQHYSPRPMADHLPYQTRAYQYYNTDNDFGSSAAPHIATLNIYKPSSNCVNGQNYHLKMYPRFN
jgi:hypothetical protein